MVKKMTKKGVQKVRSIHDKKTGLTLTADADETGSLFVLTIKKRSCRLGAIHITDNGVVCIHGFKAVFVATSDNEKPVIDGNGWIDVIRP